jgi:hypothetical protein
VVYSTGFGTQFIHRSIKVVYSLAFVNSVPTSPEFGKGVHCLILTSFASLRYLNSLL